MRVYATAADVAAYTGEDAPGNVDALLRVASRTVDVLLVGVVYDTDTDGYPTDAAVSQAMSDATCAIVREAAAAGVLAGGSKDWGSVKIGNVSLSQPIGSAGVVDVDGVPVPTDALQSLASIGDRVVGVG